MRPSKKDLRIIRCFKCLLVLLAIMAAWLISEAIEIYGLPEFMTFDKSIENSKIRFDSNGNRINRGWE